MSSSKKFYPPQAQRNGFTLVELLVVIGIIALLISMLLPALTHAKRQAVIVQCAARMHNNGIALLNYASDFKGQLPQTYANSENTAVTGAQGGTWIWDMQVATRNLLIRYGATRESMYCPSNSLQNNDTLWNFGVTATSTTGTALFAGNQGTGTYTDAGGNAYNGPPNMPIETGFGVMGYVWLINRLDGNFPTDQYTTPLQTPGNSIPTGHANHWCYQASIRPHNTPDITGYVKPNVSSDTEISCDAVCSTANAPYSFGAVVGGWAGHTHQTSHWSGGVPIGGNILFLDGHVSWRNANTTKAAGPSVKQMVKRTFTPTLNFWW